MANIETKHLNMKEAQADFAQTFAAFKAANDDRLAALEQKSTDVLLDDKVARLNAALDTQSKQIENLSLSLSRPNLERRVNTEAKSAWSSFIRTGDANALADLEGKSLSSVDAEGGYVAPIETESRIDKALSESSPFRSLATIRRIGSGLFKKPVSASGAASGWAGETEARIETQAPQLELLDFPAGELYAMPAATQALLDDGVADVDQWLADEVHDIFAAQETAAFVGGDGVNKPRGLLDYIQAENGTQSFGELGVVSTGTAGAFDSAAPTDALLDLIYAGKSRYRAGSSFVMNRRTINDIRKFKDADGHYIWQPSNEAGQPSTLLGYPLIEVEDMPDVSSGNAFTAFGDFRRGYLIVDRQGVRVLRDPYSAKPYVLFYTTKRVGGGVQDFDAIKLLKAA
ncbi:HK97 family phage major capsid protein [Litorimonas taeanensis]|uniref:HK97 family phage major capsid protein n=1 Tax=Litorimonas taeanensis TaxID=568099 RepID=A0A420WIQ2_9PROT|nr:phage major capsid protein [Litorimonas taeanensis]RKQ70904.1 HK97 family phage major capsid protein [Litorimonas taeanensis]